MKEKPAAKETGAKAYRHLLKIFLVFILSPVLSLCTPPPIRLMPGHNSGNAFLSNTLGGSGQQRSPWLVKLCLSLLTWFFFLSGLC